jgi:hypothetical protein
MRSSLVTSTVETLPLLTSESNRCSSGRCTRCLHPDTDGAPAPWPDSRRRAPAPGLPVRLVPPASRWRPAYTPPSIAGPPASRCPSLRRIGCDFSQYTALFAAQSATTGTSSRTAPLTCSCSCRARWQAALRMSLSSSLSHRCTSSGSSGASVNRPRYSSVTPPTVIRSRVARSCSASSWL